MNIVTYASPVGIRPERLWAVSLYRKTQSHEEFDGRGVLQLLRPEHAELVSLLGGESGRDTDKRSRCADLGFEWTQWRGYDVLPGCAAYVELEEVDSGDAGDHRVCICKVLASDQISETHLKTKALRDQGIIDDKGRAVVKDVVLSEDPKILLKRGFLSDGDCAKIIDSAGTQTDWSQSNAPAAQFDLERLSLLMPLLFAVPAVRFFFNDGNLLDALGVGLLALGVAGISAFLMQQVVTLAASERRTSKAVQLTDATIRHDLATRVASILAADPLHLEAPVVSRYEKGDLFAIHNDASAQPDVDWGDLGGQRLATCILYLNDVQHGGATFFDKLNIAVQPKQGDALIFYPADPITLRPDDRTTHESTPAVDDKWIVQIWQRQRRVPPPLGLPTGQLPSGLS